MPFLSSSAEVTGPSVGIRWGQWHCRESRVNLINPQREMKVPCHQARRPTINIWTTETLTLMHLAACMKLMAYALCSSIPVPIVRILGSKMMSLGLKPTLLTRRLYARVHISTFRSVSVAYEKEESTVSVKKPQLSLWRTAMAYKLIMDGVMWVLCNIYKPVPLHRMPWQQLQHRSAVQGWPFAESRTPPPSNSNCWRCTSLDSISVLLRSPQS